MKNFWRVIKIASVYRGLTIVLFAFCILSAFIELLQPQIIKLFFDLIEKQLKTGLSFESVSRQYWLYLFLFIFVIFLQSIFNSILDYVSSVWSNKTRNKLACMVFNHTETLSLNFFEKNPTGKVKERMERGIQELIDIADGLFYDIVPQIIYIFVAMYFLFRINYLFGFLILIGIPLFIIVSWIYMKSLNKYQDDFRTSEENASGIVVEALVNIKTVKSFVTELKHARDLKRQLDVSRDNAIARSYIWTKMNILRYMVINTAQILILGFGVYWALTGKITLGAFTLAWAYTNRSFYPLWYLTRLFDRIQKNLRSVKRTFEILDTTPEVLDIKNAKSLKVNKGRISFNNIDFGYEDKKILGNFDLEIKPGQAVAFVGKSGVGKSTLVKLLLRFYDPQKGQIAIDGQDISQITQKSLRENIGVVMQDSALFNDSAQNNIAYGNPSAKKEDVVKAAKAANAHDFILKLPRGYDTIVGEKGVKLSGGEQQRINIARAILKNPPILILDEATSSLDSESEKLIQNALWKLIKNRTTIIIAHRLSTVMRADLIVVLDKGKISEMDTHKQLLKKEGIYSKLFEIQSGGYLK